MTRVTRLNHFFHFGFSILNFHFRFSTSNKRVTRVTRVTIILLYIRYIYNNTIIGKEAHIFQYIHCLKIVTRWVTRLTTCHYYQHNYFILLSDSLRSGILSSFFYWDWKGDKRDSNPYLRGSKGACPFLFTGTHYAVPSDPTSSGIDLRTIGLVAIKWSHNYFILFFIQL